MGSDRDLESLVLQAALELVHRHSLDEIESVLVSTGVSSQDALKLVLLIPSAFAREHFGPQGIEFSDHFLVGPKGQFVEKAYAAEPFHRSATELARKWIEEGRLSLVMRVLDWSAEANGIKQAREQGLTPSRMSAVHHGFNE